MPAERPSTPGADRLAGRYDGFATGGGSASEVLDRRRALREVGERQDDIAVVTARVP